MGCDCRGVAAPSDRADGGFELRDRFFLHGIRGARNAPQRCPGCRGHLRLAILIQAAETSHPHGSAQKRKKRPLIVFHILHARLKTFESSSDLQISCKKNHVEYQAKVLNSAHLKNSLYSFLAANQANRNVGYLAPVGSIDSSMSKSSLHRARHVALSPCTYSELGLALRMRSINLKDISTSAIPRQVLQTMLYSAQ